MIAYVNNQFIEEETATIGTGDLSIQRGYGIFDYFRTCSNIPLFIEDHLDRFFTSAKALRLQSPHSREGLKAVIYEMIRLNNIPDSGFRLILTGGYSPDNFEPVSPNLIILQQPIELPSTEKFQKGLKIILHEYLRDVPFAKSINYLMSIYLLDKMRQQNADDVLYHYNNCVLEFPRSNVFIVTKEKSVVTPSENILWGITRKKVLELAGKEYITEERNITVEELITSDEVFLTGTTKRILPVLKINNNIIGNGVPGEVTNRLQLLFIKNEEAFLNAANKNNTYSKK